MIAPLPRVVVRIAESISLSIRKSLIVSILGIVSIFRHVLSIVVILGQIPRVLVPGIAAKKRKKLRNLEDKNLFIYKLFLPESGIVFRIIFAGDSVESGIIAITVLILGKVTRFYRYYTICTEISILL